MTLQRTIYLVDVLLLYTLLMLVAAPALVLLVQGKSLVLLAASWLVWAGWQVSPGTADLGINGNAVFNPGLLAGHLRHRHGCRPPPPGDRELDYQAPW